jgi:hypothetical protein
MRKLIGHTISHDKDGKLIREPVYGEQTIEEIFRETLAGKEDEDTAGEAGALDGIKALAGC